MTQQEAVEYIKDRVPEHFKVVAERSEYEGHEYDEVCISVDYHAVLCGQVDAAFDKLEVDWLLEQLGESLQVAL
jgi:hypothetical protein